VVDDDYASLVLSLEETLSRDEIARSLAVDRQMVDEIASGYVPNDAVAARLRALTAAPERVPLRENRKALIAIFIATDIVFFGIVIAIVLLR
jgi:hypothetical protein